MTELDMFEIEVVSGGKPLVVILLNVVGAAVYDVAKAYGAWLASEGPGVGPTLSPAMMAVAGGNIGA